MTVYTSSFTLDSHSRNHWIDITSHVQSIVSASTLNDGIVTVTAQHTTAAITVNENGDPDVERDLFAKLSALVPYEESYYRHFEGNSDSHVKTSLLGCTQTMPVINGKITLGTWQSIYFCEFDGPRSGRTCTVVVMGV